ncbi:MAG: tetratricopeptide repeat protein [Planctomycetes bacterium]|nr:tetratricopeptide repeat protein [Planctomycetota bacterium]
MPGPTTARALGNLAGVLKHLDNPADALPLLQSALAIHENALGPEHPDVAVALGNVAMVLKDLSLAREALPLEERAAAILEARLGPDHPNARVVKKNLEAIRQAAEKVQFPRVRPYPPLGSACSARQVSAICRPPGGGECEAKTRRR